MNPGKPTVVWLFALCVGALTAGACGGGAAAAGTFSCVAGFPAADGGASTPAICIEVAGATSSDQESGRQMCATQQNHFFLEPCPRAGAVGGCRLSQGGKTITTWYYYDGAGSPAEQTQQIKDICIFPGSVFVMP